MAVKGSCESQEDQEIPRQNCSHAGQKGKAKPPYDRTRPRRRLDTGVVVHCSIPQCCLHKHDLHGRVIRRKPSPMTSSQTSMSKVSKTTSRKATGILEAIYWILLTLTLILLGSFNKHIQKHSSSVSVQSVTLQNAIYSMVLSPDPGVPMHYIVLVKSDATSLSGYLVSCSSD